MSIAQTWFQLLGLPPFGRAQGKEAFFFLFNVIQKVLEETGFQVSRPLWFHFSTWGDRLPPSLWAKHFEPWKKGASVTRTAMETPGTGFVTLKVPDLWTHFTGNQLKSEDSIRKEAHVAVPNEGPERLGPLVSSTSLEQDNDPFEL